MSFAVAILALAAAAHGFACVPFGLYMPDMLPQWRDRSQFAKICVSALFVSSGALLLAMSLAIGLWPGDGSTWTLVVTGAALLEVAGFAVFWDGRRAMFVSEGGIGTLIGVAIATLAGAILSR